MKVILNGTQGQVLIDFFVGSYDKEPVSMTDDASSGYGIPMPIAPSKESIFSLGKTINFIGNWIQ